MLHCHLIVTSASYSPSRLLIKSADRFKLNMLILTALYLLSSLYYFVTWFKLFRKATGLSPQEESLSWTVLIVATLLWPLVVPISFFEKRLKAQQPLVQNYQLISVLK